MSNVLVVYTLFTLGSVKSSSNSLQANLCPGVNKTNLARQQPFTIYQKVTSQSVFKLYNFNIPYVIRGLKRAPKVTIHNILTYPSPSPRPSPLLKAPGFWLESMERQVLPEENHLTNWSTISFRCTVKFPTTTLHRLKVVQKS